MPYLELLPSCLPTYESKSAIAPYQFGSCVHNAPSNEVPLYHAPLKCDMLPAAFSPRCSVTGSLLIVPLCLRCALPRGLSQHLHCPKHRVRLGTVGLVS